MSTMKAIVCDAYGPPEVLKLKEVTKPAPGKEEVLIKVHASSVNAADCNVRGLTYIPTGLGFVARSMLGFKKPKISIIGSVFAGEIVETGSEVEGFKVGDRVYGTGPQLGAYAEYMCRPVEGALAIMPANISFEEAATIPYGALTALYFLYDRAHVGPGQKVLVKGASGGVGAYAVQLARIFGAEVSGVCSTPHVEYVKSLGAHRVFDYTVEDYTRSGETWEVIFDVVVGQTSFAKNKSSLAPGGFYLAVAGGLNEMLAMVRTSVTGGKRVVFGGGTACEKKESLDFLTELIEAGDLKPVLDRSFTLEQMAEAHRYVESGQKKGNIAVKIG